MSNNKDIETNIVQEEKKPSKFKAWWRENWTTALGIAGTIAGTAGLVYFGKKGLDGALNTLKAESLSKYGAAAGLDLLSDSGTYEERVEKAITKIKEDRELSELTETVKTKIDELSDLCKDKGVDMRIGAILGGDDGGKICETLTYVDDLYID